LLSLTSIFYFLDELWTQVIFLAAAFVTGKVANFADGWAFTFTIGWLVAFAIGCVTFETGWAPTFSAGSAEWEEPTFKIILEAVTDC
jgi:hypothetical protein